MRAKPLKSILAVMSTLLLTACPGEETQSSTPPVDHGQQESLSRLKGVPAEKNLKNIGSKNRQGAKAYNPGNPDNSARGGKTLMAVYLMGSDLESKGLAGSKDMLEMLIGLEGMSAEAKARLDLVVGFGGAKKPGWQGIKYVTPDCMMADLQDGQFGNADCYAFEDEAANMGDPNTLAAFLTYLQEHYPAENYGKTFLDLWDHGNAHLGYGPDENFGFPQGMMKLPELETALASYRQKFDLLGFDACLMGNLDVARYVNDHAHYLLASEELEPGHGWNYTDVLQAMTKDEDISVVEIGQALVDSFITHKEHQARGGKTLSLVNLDQYEPLAKALDDMSDVLNEALVDNFDEILESASKSQGFGKRSKADAGYAIDALHFLKLLKAKTDDVDTSALETALKKYIMYSRQDGTRPHAQGAAIFSINNDVHYDKELYNPDTSASDAWYDFVETFLNFGLDDAEDPVIAEAPDDTEQELEFDEEDNPLVDDYEYEDEDVSEGSATEAEESEEEHASLWMPSAHAQTTRSGWSKRENPCADGYCYRVSDNKGLEEVIAVRVTEVKPERFRFLSIVPALEIAEDIYRTPRWDGKALYLCLNADCQPKERILVPIEYDEITDDDTVIYMADGTLNEDEVTFYFEIDEHREVVDAWAVPYEEDAQGFEIVTREQWELEDDDEIAFYIEEYNMEDDTDDIYELTPSLVLTEESDFYFLKTEGTPQTFLVAEDMKGNVENSPLQNLK